jgi:hypothetical protein
LICAIRQIFDGALEPLGIVDGVSFRLIQELPSPGVFERVRQNERGILDLLKACSHLRPRGADFLDMTVLVQPPIPAP